MTKLSIGVIAAALALSMSACDRPAGDKSAETPQDFGSSRVAQAPGAGKAQTYKDPSVPENPPENTPSAASPEESEK